MSSHKIAHLRGASIPYVITHSLLQLLQKKPERRLGVTRSEITDHSFFRDIDWDKLENLEVQPPFKPSNVSVPNTLYITTSFEFVWHTQCRKQRCRYIIYCNKVFGDLYLPILEFILAIFLLSYLLFKHYCLIAANLEAQMIVLACLLFTELYYLLWKQTMQLSSYTFTVNW